MTLQEILRDQSVRTWETMAASARLGEMIREDALTSTNLAMIDHRSRESGVGLHITSFQGARLESEFGADWLWGQNGLRYLVQAKRLDVVPRVGGLNYTINVPQLRILVDSAQDLTEREDSPVLPAYVLYNSLIEGGDPATLGCIFFNAVSLLDSILREGKGDQGTVTLRPEEAIRDLGARPWFQMFD